MANRYGLEKSQRFGYWVWIIKRKCNNCGKEYRISAGDTRRTPQLGVGAIMCDCGSTLRLR